MVRIEVKYDFSAEEVEQLKALFGVETKKAVMALLQSKEPQVEKVEVQKPDRWNYDGGTYTTTIRGKSVKVWRGWGTLGAAVRIWEKYDDEFFLPWAEAKYGRRD